MLPTQEQLNQKIVEASQGHPDFETWANSLSAIILQTLQSANVVVDPGIPVSTAGSPAAQTGATTGPGTGRLR